MEFLSSAGWINPQIEYLLWLQNIRLQLGDVLDGFFLSLTRFGELLFPSLFMFIIYWCIDAKSGIYLFTLNSYSLILNQLFKMIACVYRPWILSDQIHPSELAIKRAGGYSFPSGHSTMAASSLGGIAYLYRSKKWLCAFLICLILVVGFSRNYLGVHTPQDVLFGFIVGIILIFVLNRFINWCEEDKDRYLYVLTITNIVAVLILYFILHKSYPEDYVNGKLLVNPAGAINTTIVYFGWILGILNGSMLCRRFFPFDAKAGSVRNKVIRGCVGLLVAYGLMSIIQVCFFDQRQGHLLTFVSTFVIGYTLTAIYPYAFSKFCKN